MRATQSKALRRLCSPFLYLLVLCLTAFLAGPRAVQAQAQAQVQDDPPASVDGPDIRVIDVQPQTNGAELDQMRKDFEAGHIIRLIGGQPDSLRGMLGITLQKAEASSSTSRNGLPGVADKSLLRAIAVRRNRDGHVHELEVFTGDSDDAPETSWRDHFRRWAEHERRTAAVGDPQPPAQVWTLLIQNTIQFRTNASNYEQLTLSLYSLNTGNAGTNWYMVLTDPSRTPNWDGLCNGYDHCGWHTEDSSVTIQLNGGIVTDHGPTGTIESESAGFTIGASLSSGGGVDGSFSQSWSQSDITTTDNSNSAEAAWAEYWNFGAGRVRCNPAFGSVPATSSGTFASYQGAIFSVPAATTSFSAPILFQTGFCQYLGDTTPTQTNTDTPTISTTILTGPPQLASVPASLEIPSGGKSALSISAIIPDSPENLVWNLSNVPTWLVLAPGPYAGSKFLPLTVEPGTPNGQVAELQIDTNPPFAASSVRTGPLVAHITVGTGGPTILPPSGVLITGGAQGHQVISTAQVFDEKKKTIQLVGNMTSPRVSHTITRLADGNILVTGGFSQFGNFAGVPAAALSSAEIYDPGTLQFTLVTGQMTSSRWGHTATLLGDGRVLLVGGRDVTGEVVATAEIYDPKTRTFSAAGAMHYARYLHGAVATSDGKKVVVFGGAGSPNSQQNSPRTYEVWDSTSGGFTSEGSLPVGQLSFPAPVEGPASDWLIVGGRDSSYSPTSQEQDLLVDNQAFSRGDLLNTARYGHTLTRLSDGNALVVGGVNATALDSAELRNSTGWHTLAAHLQSARGDHTATRVADGTVLVAGGSDLNGTPLSSTEIYDPASQTFTAGPSMVAASAAQAVYFTPANVPSSITLTSSANPSTYGNPFTLTAIVSPGGATGSVTFYDGSAKLGTVTVVSSQAVLQVTSLAAGAHALTAAYGGDSTFAPGTSAVLTQTVQPKATTSSLISSPNPAQLNATVTLHATVLDIGGNSVDGGEVRFFDGANLLGSGTLSAGSATLETNTLNLGTHTLRANFTGNANFAASTSAALTQTIQAPLIVTAAILSSSANPSTYLQPVVFTASVVPVSGSQSPTGRVLLYDGNTLLEAHLLAAGAATFTLNTLNIGLHSMSIIYAGDSTFGGSKSAPVPQVVHPGAVTVTVVTSPNPSAFGQPVQLQARVTPATGGVQPTGSVIYKDGAVVIGQAALGSSLNISTLSGGSHSITAVYSGDGNYQGGVSPVVVQQVTPASTSSTIASSANPSAYGQSVTFTSTVSSNASGALTGTVTFQDGATSLGTAALHAGAASLTTSTLTSGAHSITAVYSGDANFATSSSSMLPQRVTPATTTTTVTSNQSSTVFGQTVTFTATVATPSAAQPAGTVTFKDGSNTLGTITLSGGTASLSTSTLDAGPHTITAVYGGGANFTGSLSRAILQTIAQAPSTVSLQTSLNPSFFGQSVTFTASVGSSVGTPSGNVTFTDGGNTLATVAISSGQAVFSLGALAGGLHQIVATYNGDTNHAKTQSRAVAQRVNKTPSTIALVSSANPSKAGQAVAFTATVSSQTTGAPAGIVRFMDGATLLGTRALSGGLAALTISTLPTGSHIVTAVYSGDTNFQGSTSNTVQQVVQSSQTVTVTSLSSSVNPSAVGQIITFSARVSGTGGTPTGAVTFMDGSTTLGVSSLTAGAAGYSSNKLAAGTHTITAVYGGDTDFQSSTSNPVQQVVTGLLPSAVSLTSSPNPSKLGQEVVFTAIASFPEGGTPTGSITISEGATIYGSSPLVNGKGVVKTSALSSGNHLLHATYGGDTTHSGATSGTLIQHVNQ